MRRGNERPIGGLPAPSLLVSSLGSSTGQPLAERPGRVLVPPRRAELTPDRRAVLLLPPERPADNVGENNPFAVASAA